MQPKMDPAIERLAPLVDFLADTLGPFCEVVLHDFSNPTGSVVKIRNGHITGRTVGSTVSEQYLKHFQELDGKANPPVTYSSMSVTKEGRRLKGSCYIVRKQHRTIGLLNINMDVSMVQPMFAFLNGICGIPNVAEDQAEAKVEEEFAPSFQSLMEDLIAKTLAEGGKTPEEMSREEKLAFLSSLDAQGFFLIRGAVREIAKRLGLSQPSIYKYLTEQRESSTPSQKSEEQKRRRYVSSSAFVSGNLPAAGEPI